MHSLHLCSTLPTIILFVPLHDSSSRAVQMRRWLEMVVANLLPCQEGPHRRGCTGFYPALAFTLPKSLLLWNRQNNGLNSALTMFAHGSQFQITAYGFFYAEWFPSRCPSSLSSSPCSAGLNFRDTVYLRLHLLRANPGLLVQLGSCRL